MRTKILEYVARERQHLADFARALHKFEHKMIARLTLIGHTVYYGLVSIEAHANYRFAAMAVLALVILETVPAPKD